MTSVAPSARPRPMSPHLSVYRMQFTMVMSGFHRITGVGLVIGTLMFAWWIIAAGAGPEYFDVAQGFIGSWFGILLLLGWSFALFYHLCNGVRHMLWDIGIGLEIDGIKTGGVIMLATASALTLVSWIIAIASW